jgi:hypothetical protein
MAGLFAFHSASHAFTVFLPGIGVALGVIPAEGAVVAAAVVSVPARHSVTKSFRVLPLACRVSLFAVHSAAQALSVFAERVGEAVAGEVPACDGNVAGSAEGSADAVSARHSVMKSFFFLPLAWMVALLAFQSSSQAFTVLEEDGEEMKRLEATTAANPQMSSACFIRNTPDRG